MAGAFNLQLDADFAAIEAQEDEKHQAEEYAAAEMGSKQRSTLLLR